MWNTFEKCKMQLNRSGENIVFEGGILREELKAQTQSLKEKYKSISVSRAKAEVMNYILKNAGLYIADEDMFVTRIDHAGIMWDFQWQMRCETNCDDISKNIQELEGGNVIRANMDFCHIAPDW